VNPSTALATVVVDEMVRRGVREAVLSPGSRNAPLSFALHEADRLGRLRLHVRIDERTAGFLALGLAKASQRPVPVVTTSGTAAVNLFPAVVEAHYSRVPLIAVTADRPAELRGTGANQTIDQVRLFGGYPQFFHDLSVDTEPTADDWRTVVAGAVAAGGPAHLNIAFREPLVPDDGDSADQLSTVTFGSQNSPKHLPNVTVEEGEAPLATGKRTVVVAGDQALADARRLAGAGGWPLLAEPSSGHRAGPNALATYRLWLDRLAGEVERVIVAGRPTLSRPVSRLLVRDGVDVVRLRDRTPTVTGDPDHAWLARWRDADDAVRKAVSDVLAGAWPSGPAAAREIAAAMTADALLVAGSSSAVRDLDLADPWDVDPPTVLANRGASGIDGTVSTAVGAALAHRRDGGGHAVALVGDLTLLHDTTGLVIGPGEPRPDLTIVVVNDDGGGLFTLLEQGEPQHAAVFERVFGTPHGVNVQALCAATRTSYERAYSPDDLRAALAPRPGTTVVEVRTDRTRTRDLHARLHAAAVDALAR